MADAVAPNQPEADTRLTQYPEELQQIEQAVPLSNREKCNNPLPEPDPLTIHSTIDNRDSK